MRASDFLREAPLPDDWDTNVYQQPKSFKSMIDYAVERALKLGTGSSRVAFTIEYQGRPTALKIAKNSKGIAQNEAEASILGDGYVRALEVTIPLIDFGDDTQHRTTWLQTEVAQKVTNSQLCKYFGIEHLGQLVDYAHGMIGKVSRRNVDQLLDDLDAHGQTDAQREIFEDYAQRLAELCTNFDVMLGDFERAANWGMYKGHPVVIDIGFTKSVHKHHYSR